MTLLLDRLAHLDSQRLLGIRRGVEKESLRAGDNGSLALTPHPAALGSALTHPHITTDFSESQIEIVTGVHSNAQAVVDELTQVHQFTYRAMAADELLWVSSMPCGLPTDETIPLGRYGSSNVGRAKSVYRMGLGHRYGRRMQTISGIHYNWSLPEVSSEEYFALIRNFRRHAFLLLYLFGASPTLCSSFVQGRTHELLPLGSQRSDATSSLATDHSIAHTMHLPYATSLRMGRLGYQSDAQATLAVSYNSLEGYAASLQEALTKPYPVYEAVGVRNPGGDYNQLATSLLQIENEFYGTIRPKRVIRTGERPLHALRQRGVEYVEVRLLDLDPFEPVGIQADTMRFIDIFLLHCLLANSPQDTPQEIAALARNQHLTAGFGREPGLKLERLAQGKTTEIGLTEWSAELLTEFAPIALALDAAHDSSDYSAALQSAQEHLQDSSRLPSARVLAAVKSQHQNSYVKFISAQSKQTKQALLALPYSAAQHAYFERLTEQSNADQQAMEAADTQSFEDYRLQYVSAQRLQVQDEQVDELLLQS